MTLATTLEHVTKEVLRSRQAARFLEEARVRQPALVAFETAEALVAALDLRSPLCADERASLVGALVAESRRAPAAIWSSLILVAFAPMLRRLRARFGRRPNEDLDQEILASFLDAVRTVGAGPHLALALRWRTEKLVYRAVRSDRRAAEMLPFDEETHPADVFELEAVRKAATAEVVRIVESLGAGDLVEVLLTTNGGAEQLKAYAARTYAGRTKKGLAAEYDRLCRARLRLVRDLRAHFHEGAAA
jgi:hypothetical protein